MVAVTLAHTLDYQREVARTFGLGEFEAQPGVVHLVHLDGHYLFQLLDAALHLHRLGRLVAEPLDELLGVGYHLLLVLVGAHLLFHALLAQLQEL